MGEKRVDKNAKCRWLIMKYDKNYSIRMESCSASYEQTRAPIIDLL